MQKLNISNTSRQDREKIASALDQWVSRLKERLTDPQPELETASLRGQIMILRKVIRELTPEFAAEQGRVGNDYEELQPSSHSAGYDPIE